MLEGFQGRRVLLLQGPNGPFFQRLADELESVGAQVYKINFNAADAHYFPGSRASNYRGNFQDWPQFAQHFCQKEDIEIVFLFGDCRKYHRSVIQKFEEAGLAVYVFEEGYLRPHYLTIERGGVNHHSELRKGWNSEQDLSDAPDDEALDLRHTYWFNSYYAIIYALRMYLGRKDFPHYEHHRDLSLLKQARLWWLSLGRKFYYQMKERSLQKRLSVELSAKYFLAPLQVYNDFQIRMSRFADVREFIEEVMRTFAVSASADDYLVFKHHPLDRAYRDYTKFLKKLSRELGVESRVLYVHDLDLPSLLKNAKGTIVVNSTVGLSSLYHGTPTLALDEAIYSYMRLSASCSLAEFFTAPPAVDIERVGRARRWLLMHNQAKGSSARVASGAGATGLHWPPRCFW